MTQLQQAGEAAQLVGKLVALHPQHLGVLAQMSHLHSQTGGHLRTTEDQQPPRRLALHRLPAADKGLPLNGEAHLPRLLLQTGAQRRHQLRQRLPQQGVTPGTWQPQLITGGAVDHVDVAAAIERDHPLGDVLQHQILQGEAAHDRLRLQIEQGLAQQILHPERQQQAASQHRHDGADEQGHPLHVDALHLLHQVAHHHGPHDAPVTAHHRREAADRWPHGAPILGTVAAPLLQRGPDILTTELLPHQLGVGVAETATMLVGHHHIGGIGAVTDRLHVVAQGRVTALTQGLDHPGIGRHDPCQIAPLILQIALQQMTDKEGQQAAQNEDQQQGEPKREGDQLMAKFHAHTLNRQDAAQ